MAEVIKYAVIAVAAFVIGGFVGRFLASAVGEPGSDQTSSQSIAATSPAIQEYAIEGMSCQGCVNTLTTTLKNIPGVQMVKVSLAEKRAVVVADPTDATRKKIQSAVADAGYTAKPILDDPATPSMMPASQTDTGKPASH